MDFRLTRKEIERNDLSILSLLSANRESVAAYNHQAQGSFSQLRLCQSFMTAAKAFKVIDSPTEGVIVPYGDGERIIAELMCRFGEDRLKLLKEAQRYSVSMFPYEMAKLKEKRALGEVWEGSGVFYLDERYYSDQFGASTDEVAQMKVRIV